jgi:hypothetical protein
VHGSADTKPERGVGAATSWSIGVEYLRAVAARDYAGAGSLLDDASARDGIGEVNGALSDAGRALLDRVVFEPGTIDVLDVVGTLAERAIELAGTTRCDNEARLRSLIVYLGSEGLPCAARSEVAVWSPLERREALVTLVAGLAAWVAMRDGIDLAELAGTLAPPETAAPALGTFGLAWRGDDGTPTPLYGAVPAGYAPHITFLGSAPCSLRSLFARVAYLRDARPGSAAPRQRIGAYEQALVTAPSASSTKPSSASDGVAFGAPVAGSVAVRRPADTATEA